jgi:hypothetical protein
MAAVLLLVAIIAAIALTLRAQGQQVPGPVQQVRREGGPIVRWSRWRR